MRARSFAGLGLIVAFAAVPSVASAACPNVVSGASSLDEIDAPTRLRYLQKHLDREGARADLWTFGWIGAGAAATAFNGVWGATTSSYSERIDRFGAASGTLMLTVTTILSPLSVPTEAPRSKDGEPESKEKPDDGATCAAVVRAERVLAAVAKDESDRQGFLGHALPIAGATAGGLVLGFGYGHWTGGAVNAGIGIVVSELKLMSQPMGGVRTLARYRTGVLSEDGPRATWTVTPFVGKDSGGAALSLVF